MSTVAALEERQLHAHDAALDADEVAAGAIAALAAEVWARHIGTPMPGHLVEEGIGEVCSAFDEEELAALGTAFAAGERALGEFLHPKVCGYWEAWCLERAREQYELLQRQAEADMTTGGWK